MSRCDTSELTPLRIFLEVLKTCSRHIQTSNMNLAEHILTQSKRLCDTKVHLDKTCIDKGLVINKLHSRGHIHLLYDSTIESMLPDTLKAMGKIYFLQAPAAHEGTIRNLLKP